LLLNVVDGTVWLFYIGHCFFFFDCAGSSPHTQKLASMCVSKHDTGE